MGGSAWQWRTPEQRTNYGLTTGAQGGEHAVYFATSPGCSVRLGNRPWLSMTLGFCRIWHPPVGCLPAPLPYLCAGGDHVRCHLPEDPRDGRDIQAGRARVTAAHNLARPQEHVPHQSVWCAAASCWARPGSNWGHAWACLPVCGVTPFTHTYLHWVTHLFVCSFCCLPQCKIIEACLPRRCLQIYPG